MLSKVLVGGLTALAAFGGADAFSAGSALPARAASRAAACSLRMQEAPKDDGLNTRRTVIGGLFGAMLAGQAMTPTEAEAARSGGRVGGGFKKSPTSRSSASKTRTSATSTTVVKPTTVIVQPTPVYGGYGGGFGGGFGYGGFGPPISPGMWMGLGALELAQTYAREQRRQEFYRQQLETQRKLGQDEAAIQSLEKQLAQQNQMLMEMQKKLPNN